jgi:8-oxo-dGTP diphosphatase
VIEAAGGVIARVDGGDLLVAVVHRPKYDDWSFPKGKLERGEDHPTAALREVEEETGIRCRLGAELPEARYRHRDGEPKRVRYWQMEPTGGDFAANAEVDALEWLSVDDARERLSYDYDRLVLDGLAELVEAGASG